MAPPLVGDAAVGVEARNRRALHAFISQFIEMVGIGLESVIPKPEMPLGDFAAKSAGYTGQRHIQVHHRQPKCPMWPAETRKLFENSSAR